MSFVSGKADAI